MVAALPSLVQSDFHACAFQPTETDCWNGPGDVMAPPLQARSVLATWQKAKAECLSTLHSQREIPPLHSGRIPTTQCESKTAIAHNPSVTTLEWETASRYA